MVENERIFMEHDQTIELFILQLNNSEKKKTKEKEYDRHFNPSTAPACNISGLRDARTRLQTVYFPVL